MKNTNLERATMRYLFIDGNNLASRCRHTGMSDLAAPDGTKTGVLYGCIRGASWARNSVLAEESSTVVFWDGGHSAGRKALFPGYKADKSGKTPTQEELDDFASFRVQCSLAREALSLIGIRQIHVNGVEADDLISIFASAYSANNTVCIYSNDKDFHQLVSDNVLIFDATRGLQTKAQVLERWEVTSPDDILILRALSGDDSDSIPGIAGIGPKRALIVLRHFDQIADDCACPNDVSESDWKWVEKAQENLAVFLRNWRIMRLPRAWNESFYIPEAALEATAQMRGTGIRRDVRKFIEFCKRYELTSILDEISLV